MFVMGNFFTFADTHQHICNKIEKGGKSEANWRKRNVLLELWSTLRRHTFYDKHDQAISLQIFCERVAFFWNNHCLATLKIIVNLETCLVNITWLISTLSGKPQYGGKSFVLCGVTSRTLSTLRVHSLSCLLKWIPIKYSGSKFFTVEKALRSERTQSLVTSTLCNSAAKFVSWSGGGVNQVRLLGNR